MLNYRGYIANVSIDVEEGILSGRVINTRDVIHFEAETLAQLEKEFQFSVDDYIAFCKEHGMEPEKPRSGKISLRVSPKIHSAALSAAAREGKSLNAWISKTIEKAAIG
jgi:predicted HicB family RNase H-like nuclease